MDMRKYISGNFVKVDDVRDGPIEDKIAVVKEGQYDKPNVVFESGAILSLSATNVKILTKAYGTESDKWLGKTIERFLGVIQYGGTDHEAVLVRPISPLIKKAKNNDKKPSGDMGDEIPF